MTSERCLELYRDKEFQKFIWSECRKRARDKQIQGACFSEAWTWISTRAPDDMCIDALKDYAVRAIFNEYRKELRERKLVGKLLDLCIQEDGEMPDFERFGHRHDAGMMLETSKRGD